MVILADNRLPEQAKSVLSESGKLIQMESSGIVYEAISGHPDIFFCQNGEAWIAAPNAPQIIIDNLIKHNQELHVGEKYLGRKYPETAYYNAVVTENLLIHNLKITDPEILKISAGKEKIHVEQGYTRCNLVPLNECGFITSDKGIETTLLKSGKNVLFVDSSEIILPGFKNGFFGGCCGVKEDLLFIAGSLRFIHNGDQIKTFADCCGFGIVELYDGPLIDGGGIFFL